MTICEDNQLWQSLFFRDFGHYHSLGEATIEETGWKERYKECSLVLTWNPDVVDDQGEKVYIFSEGNRKILRDNGRGYNPKVCSSLVLELLLCLLPASNVIHSHTNLPSSMS